MAAEALINSQISNPAIRVASLARLLLIVVCLLVPGLLAAQDVAQYELGAGDRVRVTVFGEQDLSGEFEIDGTGQISMPLIGTVPVGGKTVRGLEAQIISQLKDGYLRDPKVSVEVLNYRPFYILGEVKEPGSYPYRSGMSVLNAVVMAGGYTYRADEDDITIQRGGEGARATPVNPETPVLPGDVIRVEERFF